MCRDNQFPGGCKSCGIGLSLPKLQIKRPVEVFKSSFAFHHHARSGFHTSSFTLSYNVGINCHERHVKRQLHAVSGAR
jgi:hypothetical protein